MKKFIATTAILIAGTSSAFAQNFELRFSTFLPPVHPVHAAVEEWAASISEQSGGTISVTLYPAQQLGRADDNYDMTRDGIADLSFVNVGYQAGRFPIAEAVHLPFLISDGVAGSRVFDEWYRPIAATEMHEVKYCLGFTHAPASLHSKREIRTPDDLEGLQVRSANSVIANFVTQLGGNNVRVSAPETRTALESGVADAVTFPWGSISPFGLDNVLSHAMDAPFYLSGFAWTLHPGTYERMTNDQKAVIDAHCTSDWAERVATIWDEHENSGYEALKNSDDYTVYSLTDEEFAAWLEAADVAQARWASDAIDAGVEAPEGVLEDLEAALKAADVSLR